MRVFVKRGAAGGGGQRPYAVTNSGVTSPIHQTGAAYLALPVRRRSGPLRGQRPHAVGKRGGYFNQPRFLKYHIGTTALSAISTSA